MDKFLQFLDSLALVIGRVVICVAIGCPIGCLIGHFIVSVLIK